MAMQTFISWKMFVQPISISLEEVEHIKNNQFYGIDTLATQNIRST